MDEMSADWETSVEAPAAEDGQGSTRDSSR